MSQPEIIEEKPIVIFQLRDEIDKIKKRDKELGIRTSKTEDFLNAFAGMSAAKGKQLFDKLSKLSIPRLKENHIYKIIDLMPSSVDDLKLVLSGYSISISNDNAKKIVDTVAGFAPKT